MPANTAGIIVLKTETMRTKFFILMMLICEKIVFAQAVYPIDKGAFSINGNIGIVTKGGDLYSSDGNRYTEISVSPSVNYFAANSFFIGAATQSTSQKQGSIHITKVSVGPHIGVAGLFHTNIIPSLSIGIRYRFEKYNLDKNVNLSIHGHEVVYSFGIIYLIKKHLGLNFGIEYQFMKLGPGGGYVPLNGDILSFKIGLSGLLFKGVDKNTGTQ